MKILIVEDEQLLRHHLTVRLSDLGHIVSSVANADEALRSVKDNHYDIAVVDIGLPGTNGLELIRQLREQEYTFPILILTARGSWQDKVEGLSTGADDYVVKPFQFEELEARLNVLNRRASGIVQPILTVGSLKLDLNRKRAFCNETPLQLTAYEYRLLEYLMRHSQQVVAKERLMEQLYKDEEERDSNVIEVLVGRLRRKLESQCGIQPIETVRGQGYLFTESCS
ncbi:response regulator [Entomomonas asaccharolytica]|uniref:Response regulator n=1 Tax=Entomomonas asaccharolytica TaxID=2785331 RepID=A0A974RVW1_9GAMM|nr:response regulator [Entomomonas asaccharolytica]QQP84591.1 response regulator [Entomomonas asaccharolytica]